MVELRELLLKERIRILLDDLDGALSRVNNRLQPPLTPGRVHKITRRLTDATRAEIVASYEAGTPSTQLIEQYRLGKGTVLRLLREEGVTVRRQPLTDAEVREALALYESGWSMARIGDKLARQHTVIRDVLDRTGVQRRDSHGRPRESELPR
jgi:hypothetical protein